MNGLPHGPNPGLAPPSGDFHVGFGARLAQVVAARRGFSNWIACSRLVALERLSKRRHGELLWKSRRGTLLTTSRSDWYPAIECFGMDIYGLGLLTEDVRSFLDLGANSGCFTLAIKEHFANARGRAYEPAPKMFEHLSGNVSRNSWSDSVEVVQAAVTGSAIGAVELRYQPSAPSTSTVAGLLPGGNDTGVLLTVPAVSLSTVLSEMGPVDLVKMDIEGSEYDVLLRTPLEQLKSIRRLVMEIHPSPTHRPSEIVDHLGRAGLRLIAHGAPAVALGPFRLAWYGELMWFGSWV